MGKASTEFAGINSGLETVANNLAVFNVA